MATLTIQAGVSGLGAHISVEVGQDVRGQGSARPEGGASKATGVSDADDALAGEEGRVAHEFVVGFADAGGLLLEDVWQQGRPGDTVEEQLSCGCCIVSRSLQVARGRCVLCRGGVTS